MKNYLTEDRYYCPICNRYFDVSSYLKETFKGKPKSLWFANMVTHYRHQHITWWDKCWGRNGKYYQGNWFKDYEEEKRKVNESSKRQIIRKTTDFMSKIGFEKEDLMMLKNNEKQTIELFDKKMIKE